MTRPAGSKLRWVVKVGSALITAEKTGLNFNNIRHWCQQLAALAEDNIELVLLPDQLHRACINSSGKPDHMPFTNYKPQLRSVKWDWLKPTNRNLIATI